MPCDACDAWEAAATCAFTRYASKRWPHDSHRTRATKDVLASAVVIHSIDSVIQRAFVALVAEQAGKEHETTASIAHTGGVRRKWEWLSEQSRLGWVLAKRKFCKFGFYRYRYAVHVFLGLGCMSTLSALDRWDPFARGCGSLWR